MLVMRRRAPDAPRGCSARRCAWPVGIFGILGCLYLFYSLPQRTQIWFLGAQVVGLVLYFALRRPAQRRRARRRPEPC